MSDRTLFSYKTNAIYKMEDGVICFKVKNDDVFDLEDLKEILELLEDANDGKPFLLLMDI